MYSQCATIALYARTTRTTAAHKEYVYYSTTTVLKYQQQLQQRHGAVLHLKST